MTFRKLRAGRVNFPADQWVGEPGTMFYDEATGVLRLADGTTPGGQYVATVDLLSGLANIRIFNANVDGNLTVLGTTSTQNNQIINNEQTLTGTLSVTGNASFTGNSVFTGNTVFVGPIQIEGNTTSTGNSFYVGNQVTTGNSQFIGYTDFIGTSRFLGPIISVGTRTSNGYSVFNGNVQFNGNVDAAGYTNFVGPTTITGNLDVSGNTTYTGRTKTIVTTVSGSTASMIVTGDASGGFQPPIQQGVMLHLTGQPNLAARFYTDGVNNFATIAGRRYNGNVQYPSGLKAGDDILRIAAAGYGATTMPATGSGRIVVTAAEDFTDTAQGAVITFQTTPIGANTLQNVANVSSAYGIWSSKFRGPLTGDVTGNLVATTAAINGNLTANSFSTFNGNVDFTANSHFYGEMHVIGQSNFNGNIEVAGNTNVTGGFNVVGPVTIGGNTSVAGNLIILGDRISTGNTVQSGPFVVTGDSTFTGNLNITGNTTITGLTSQVGNLTITGNTLSTGQVKHIVSTISGITGAVAVTGNGDGSFQVPINTGVMLHVTGQANNASRVYNDAQNNFGAFVVRRYNGNTAQPTRVLKDQDIMRISAVGYANTYMPQFGSSRIVFVANEDYTDSAQGGRLEFWTTPNGSTTLQFVANVTNANGIWSPTGFIGPVTGNVTGNISGNTAQFTGNISSANLSVSTNLTSNTAQFSGNISAANVAVGTNGVVIAPRIQFNDGGISDLGANTAPVINFGLHSIVRVTNPGGTVAASLTNYVAGSQVRLIVHMTTARQIDLGVPAAVNSTIGSTSLLTNKIGNNQCVVIDYYCVDGTANGTYAAVRYS